MNKQKETKVEEAPKIEVKPEEATNTAVTAPAEVKVNQA